MKASRERQERFMRSFGNDDYVAEEAADMIRHNGPSWLSDDQMAQIVSKTVRNWRLGQRINIRNRKRLQAKEVV